MGKYGDGDRAFWLEANGARPYTVDRQKLPEPLRIEHLAISIVGGIQPDRLATLLMSGDDDGLGARFLFSWPEIVPPRRPRFRPEGEIVTRAMRRLRSLEFGRDPKTGDSIPVTLPIQADALDAFQDWREQHHASSQGVSGMMASAYGKMAGQALRLAIALELLWWAAGPDGTSEPAQVSGDALGAALDLIESYFRPMLARVLGEAALPAGDRLGATLAREIQRRRVDRLNATQVRREWRLPGLRESAQVMAAVGVLEEARWLKAIGERDGSTLGRKRLDFAVDPRVHRGRS